MTVKPYSIVVHRSGTHGPRIYWFEQFWLADAWYEAMASQRKRFDIEGSIRLMYGDQCLRGC